MGGWVDGGEGGSTVDTRMSERVGGKQWIST